MRGKVALSVVVACLWAGGAVAVAQTEAAPPPDTSTDTPSEAAPSETAPTPAAPVTVAPIDAGTYAVRLRDLEQRINELKEQIFRSKARLSLLAETVLEGVVGGGQTVIVHENRMSEGFKLVRVVYALDGAPIFTKADEEGAIGDQKEFEVYNGSIVPGEHTLTVNLEYRGHGYGVFAYLKGYRFKVRSTYTFSVPEGRVATLVVVGYEKGGPTTPLEERPAVRFIERIERQARPDAEGEGVR
ncbi:MAG: hypothetical protein OEM15_16365 [Myxococcales bacterium]|nr:hypothetical protein [Myxococcales bacterium]MDH3484564.1 hypothetical protein [Myxococcales bacterium]